MLARRGRQNQRFFWRAGGCEGSGCHGTSPSCHGEQPLADGQEGEDDDKEEEEEEEEDLTLFFTPELFEDEG